MRHFGILSRSRALSFDRLQCAWRNVWDPVKWFLTLIGIQFVGEFLFWSGRVRLSPGESGRVRIFESRSGLSRTWAVGRFGPTRSDLDLLFQNLTTSRGDFHQGNKANKQKVGRIELTPVDSRPIGVHGLGLEVRLALVWPGEIISLGRLAQAGAGVHTSSATHKAENLHCSRISKSDYRLHDTDHDAFIYRGCRCRK